jgi:hypothetical protein
LSWNVTTTGKVPDLSHDATIEDYENVKAPAPRAATERRPNEAILSVRPPTAVPDILTNETLVKLAKAELSDDVILSMVRTQPGRFQKSPDAVIELKEAGVSDKVIAAVLNSNSAVQLSDTAVPASPGPLLAKLESNSRIYIASMTANLNEFIGAEIIKQHLPVRVVLDERDADYILSGLSQRTEVKWYDVVSGSVVGGKDRVEASAKLVRVSDRTLVWAGESGDRSLIFGAFKRGGERKLAERIVGQMKHDLF